MLQINLATSDLKVFDNSSQANGELCYNKPCPGLMLPTPNGCVCACANDYDLNASGTKCLQQTQVKNNCGTGRIPSEVETIVGSVNYFRWYLERYSTKRFHFELDRFQCPTSRECIDLADVCDADIDCPGGDDERFENGGPCDAKNNCTFKGKLELLSIGNLFVSFHF